MKRLIIYALQNNEMKISKKSSTYMLTFQSNLRKSPPPAVKKLKLNRSIV